MNHSIRILEEQIKIERLKISNCDHDFDNHFDNPETIIKAEHGSCPYWLHEGHYEKKIDRWTRVCKICKLEQSTYKSKPIIAELIKLNS